MKKRDRIIELQAALKIARTSLEKISSGACRCPEVEATDAIDALWALEKKQQLQGLLGHEMASVNPRLRRPGMSEALPEAIRTVGDLMLALSEAERERDALRSQLKAARAELDGMPDWFQFLLRVRRGFREHEIWHQEHDDIGLANILSTKAADLYVQARQEAAALAQTKENQS